MDGDYSREVKPGDAPGASGEELARTEFAYDGQAVGAPPVQGLLTLTDGANAGQVQSFGYDWLDRLVSASTNAAGVSQYSHTHAYDAIGNMPLCGHFVNTNFAGSAYVYNPTQPHAVTAAHGNTYSYDANGNQTARTIAGVPYAMTFHAEHRRPAITGDNLAANPAQTSSIFRIGAKF